MKLSLSLAAAVLTLLYSTAQAGIIVDMRGKAVSVPDDPASVATIDDGAPLDPAIAEALGPHALALARNLRFTVSGPAEPERAQVTRGGLLTEQFCPETLEARELPGFFACGEALDVDGACGGFNLAWAWKSGLVAGRAAAQR